MCGHRLITIKRAAPIMALYDMPGNGRGDFLVKSAVPLQDGSLY